MKTQNIFSKTISGFLLGGFLALSFTPYLSLAQIAPAAKPSPQLILLESVVEIPEIVFEGKTFKDISRVDWGQKVTLNGKSVALNSDEALNTLALPYDIKNLIKEYRKEKNSVDKTILMWPYTKDRKKEYLDAGLKFSIAQELIKEGKLPANYFDLDVQGLVEPADTLIDISDVQILNPGVVIPVGEPGIEVLKVKSVDVSKEKPKVSLIERAKNLVGNTFGHLVALVGFKSAYADVATIS